MRYALLALVLTFTAITGCTDPAAPDYREQADDPELLHGAMKHLTDVMIYDIFSPPQASRSYAYASVATYEVLAAGRDEYRSLAGQLNELEAVPQPPTDRDVLLPLASVHALLRVGEAMVFSEDDVATYRDEVHERFRRMDVPRDVFDASVAYGDAVAEHVLGWAHTDMYRETRTYPKFTVVDDPERWQPTPPAYMTAIEPHWDKLRTFAMDSAAQFRPVPPVPYDMTPGSAFHEQVMDVYRVVRDLTEEQRAIAAFWDCNPYVMHTRGHAMFATKKITPGGHWMGITAIAARKAESDIMATAEAYARVSIALADGFISSWEEKYRSNLIRPETVINREIDEGWMPTLQTPPFPEYTSGHSVISAAAAETLTDLFGEPFAFDDTTEVEYGLPARSFDSFREASEEAAISRLYGGIHYRMAADEGLTQGRAVGQHVVTQVQTHVPSLASGE